MSIDKHSPWFKKEVVNCTRDHVRQGFNTEYNDGTVNFVSDLELYRDGWNFPAIQDLIRKVQK